jgi:hypothetical protein
MPRGVARRLADSGEREAGRSFGQGQVDSLWAAGGGIHQPSRQSLRCGGNRRRAGHGSAETAGGARAAALLVVTRGRMVGGRGNLRPGLVTVTCPPGHVVHGGSRCSDAMLHGRMRARQHACRRNALEGYCQQQQPDEYAAQADRDGMVHGPILAWRRRNTVVRMAVARLAAPESG